MSLTANPARVRADGSTLLVFQGPPGMIVAWRVTSGPGHVVALAGVTDAAGRAWAVYYPDGGSGTARVRVEHGT